MRKVGLYFGSFNPIHIGHLVIANYMASQTDLDEVWLVVSPQNPLKEKSTLANDYDRLHLVQLAVEDNPRLSASDIEFGLPKPSYTIDTLTYLREKHPTINFTLIMGGDNLLTLPRWKNYELLLRDYRIYVYLRPEYELGELADHDSVSLFSEVPQMHISSSYIRRCMAKGESIRYLVSEPVFQYLEDNALYR